MDNSSHQDGQRQGQSDDKSNGGTAQNGEGIISAGDSEGWTRILETLGVFIFGGVGVGLTEAGFHFWAFLCDFLAVGCGIGLVCHHIKKSRLIKRVWKLFWPLLVLDFLVFAFLFWHVEIESEKPYPHFTFSLQVGDSPAATVLLTNDCLFRAGVVNVIHFTNNFLLFNGIANGCIVIPVSPEESNKVFSLIAENDSAVKVNDLEVAVGFPKDWKLGLDSSKWHEAGEHFIIPGWKLQITNIQFWATQSPWPLFPSDSLTFPPITNSSIPKSNNPTNREGVFRLTARATDFEELLTVNVLFVRVPSNEIFKPFVASMRPGTNGLWHISMSPKEIEDSQK
jgi:hypothetical protein